MQNENLSEILNKLSDQTKNILIRALMENDRKNVAIVSEPIYKKITTANGTVVGIDIEKFVYGVSVTHKAEEYREREFVYRISYVDDNHLYHTVDVDKDNFEDAIYKIFDNGGFEVKIVCIEK